jgi:hypothetical protein
MTESFSMNHAPKRTLIMVPVSRYRPDQVE